MSKSRPPGRVSRLGLAGTIGICTAITAILNLPGCSTPLSSEAYLRLSVASPGGHLGPAKGPFVSSYFPAGKENLFVHLASEAPLGGDRVEAITTEIQEAAKGFAAGYKARQAGYDIRKRHPEGKVTFQIPPAPDGVFLPDIWRSAFIPGWGLADNEASGSPRP